tara:strand:- start:14982 stop:16025 length:1044 start_codon:yes stop_codon:yes gene_type:complete
MKTIESPILQRDNLHIFKSLREKKELLKGSRILITGSDGFLGRTIVSFLKYLNDKQFSDKDKVKIIAIDYKDYDICNSLDSFIEEGPIDYIINCAGIASPKKYLKAPLKTLDVSYLGTKSVFDLARLRNTKSILMFSSSEVYGTPDPENIPTKEEYIGTVTTFGNRSCYDIGKNVLETLSYVYYTSYNAPVNVLRPFNLYGPLMDLYDGRIVPNICKSMINQTDFSVYGSGQQTRTYCYVADAMVYMFHVLLSDSFGQIYNIGSEDEELSALHIAEKAYNLVDVPNSTFVQKPYPEEYPNQEPRRRCPNISKVKTLSRYSPQYSFEKGFLSCYMFFSQIAEDKSTNA